MKVALEHFCPQESNLRGAVSKRLQGVGAGRKQLAGNLSYMAFRDDKKALACSALVSRGKDG